MPHAYGVGKYSTVVDDLAPQKKRAMSTALSYPQPLPYQPALCCLDTFEVIGLGVVQALPHLVRDRARTLLESQPAIHPVGRSSS